MSEKGEGGLGRRNFLKIMAVAAGAGLATKAGAEIVEGVDERLWDLHNKEAFKKFVNKEEGIVLRATLGKDVKIKEGASIHSVPNNRYYRPAEGIIGMPLDMNTEVASVENDQEFKVKSDGAGINLIFSPALEGYGGNEIKEVIFESGEGSYVRKRIDTRGSWAWFTVSSIEGIDPDLKEKMINGALYEYGEGDEAKVICVNLSNLDFALEGENSFTPNFPVDAVARAHLYSLDD